MGDTGCVSMLARSAGAAYAKHAFGDSLAPSPKTARLLDLSPAKLSAMKIIRIAPFWGTLLRQIVWR